MRLALGLSLNALRAPLIGGPLSGALAGLGLTAKIVLDAGDINSWPGSGQKWLDTSGNDHDFNLGADDTVTTADPTPTGDAGALAAGNYMAFDGGDYLTLAEANPTWINNLHKDAIKAWGAAMVWVGTSGINGLFGNSAGSSSNVGFIWQINPSVDHSVLVVNGSGSGAVINQNAGGSGLATGQWHFLAFSIDESVGANGLVFITNGSVISRTSTYASPSASDATFTSQIGARGNANSLLSNGSRLAMFCMGEGVAPTSAQLLALRAAVRGRFGV